MKKTRDPGDRLTRELCRSIRNSSPRTSGKSAPSEPLQHEDPGGLCSRDQEGKERPTNQERIRETIQLALLGSLLTGFGVLIGHAVMMGGIHVDRAWQIIVTLGGLLLLAGVGSGPRAMVPKILRKLADWLESGRKEAK